ncbi:MAG: protein TolQ [Gammaproteobacteria bacterium]|nr:protein TolQ [Gammaproteobacteria bacterium]
MKTELSLGQLFLDASLLVQLIMLALIIASLYSWTIIFFKVKLFKRVRQYTDAFEERFWSGKDLMSLFNESKAQKDPTGIDNIFTSGFREFARMHKQGTLNDMQWDAIQRSMRVNLNRELDTMEDNLSVLATIGSTSPYVGLFGTVWGIMSSFTALGSMQHATLALVAPGIAEALFATAMGLFAAIPAVVAYNRFSNEVVKISNRYENFVDEFVSILMHHAASKTEEKQEGTAT